MMDEKQRKPDDDLLIHERMAKAEQTIANVRSEARIREHARLDVLEDRVGDLLDARDYFARAAMQTLVHDWCEGDSKHADAVAEHAYKFADAMMKARREHTL